MKKIIIANPLFFAFFFPALVDVVMTILGQNLQNQVVHLPNEASPAYYFLLVSPWLFLVGSVAWFLLWYLVFKKIKAPLNLFLMFLFISGHSWGSSSWIMKLLKERSVYTIGDQPSVMLAWCFLMLYLALNAVSATYCLNVYMESDKK